MRSGGSITASSSRQGGFTLLEIAFAVAILLMLGASMTAFFAVSTRVQNSNRNREIARIAATSKLEEILAWPNPATIPATFSGTTFTAGPLQGPGGNLPGRVTVDATNPALLVVTVNVDWIDVPADDSFELSVMIAP